MSERLNDDSGFDVLGDVFETLRFRGSIFFRSDLAAPWGLALEPVGVPRFHIAMAGRCFVGDENREPVEVREMEIIMLPTGNSHWIADQPGRSLVNSARAGEACELGDPLFQQGNITNNLMCGIVHYDQEFSHPLLDSLPAILHFPRLTSDDQIWTMVKLIDEEMQRTQMRSGSIVDRLTEVLFLQLLNSYVKQNDDKTGFIAALRNRRVQQSYY